MGVPKEDTADNVIQHDFSVLSADGKLAPRDQKAADKEFEAFKKAVLTTLPIALLRSDARYQTPMIHSIVESIVENFDIDAVNPPLISRRKDGTFWVIDGQHTIASFIRLGRTEIDCKVRDGLTLPKEADLFLIRNSPSSRRKLSQKQSFNARVEKGDKVAVAMNEIFKAGKWAVHGSSRSPMRITSIPLAEDCYNLDKGRSFTLALVDIDNAWPNRTSPVNLLMITAVAYLHYNGAKIGVKPDQKRLRLALGFNLKAHKRNGQYPALTPADYVDLVRGTLKVHAVPNARYMPRHLGDEILDRYNHGLAREHKLGDRYLDGLPSSLDTD